MACVAARQKFVERNHCYGFYGFGLWGLWFLFIRADNGAGVCSSLLTENPRKYDNTPFQNAEEISTLSARCYVLNTYARASSMGRF